MRKIPLFQKYGLISQDKKVKNTQLQNPDSYVLKMRKIDISGQMTVAALNWDKIKRFGYKIALT